MKNFFKLLLLFVLLFPIVTFAQTVEEVVQFIQLNADDTNVFNRDPFWTYSQNCHFLTYESGDPGFAVSLGKLYYPGYIDSGKDGLFYKAIEKKSGVFRRGYDRQDRRFFSEEVDRFYFLVRDAAMAPRVAKAFDFLIEKCGGTKVNMDLFK